MSDYKNTKKAVKYWYFRFSNDFWDLKTSRMEHIPGGYEFVVILLKLYTLSLEENGGIYVPTDDDMPEVMDIIEIARLLRHDPQVVKKAIKYFIENGFLEVEEVVSDDNVLEGFRFEFPDLEKRIGSRTRGADSKQEYKRRKQQEKELAELKELKEPETVEVKEAEEEVEKKSDYGLFHNVFLTEEEYYKFFKSFENAEQILQKLSIYKKQYGRKYNSDYAALLKFSEEDGIPTKTKSETDKKIEIFKRYKREAELGFLPPENIKDMVTENQFEELVRIAEEAEKKLRAK